MLHDRERQTEDSPIVDPAYATDKRITIARSALEWAMIAEALQAKADEMEVNGPGLERVAQEFLWRTVRHLRDELTRHGAAT